jgi:hypothetical protein
MAGRKNTAEKRSEESCKIKKFPHLIDHAYYRTQISTKDAEKIHMHFRNSHTHK